VTRHKLVRIAWLVLCLAALLVMAHPAQAQAGGVIAGQVVNGTAGGPAVGGGLPVVLHVVQGETELAPLQATTDEQGRFRFEALDVDPALAYQPEVTYLAVPYLSSQSYSFAEGQSQLDATLTVYETTEDGTSVRLDSVHMIAESFEQVLRLSEVHVFGNVADRTFTGQVNEASSGRRVTVFIPLPDNAVGLAFPDDPSGERFIQVAGGVWDTQAVPPGADTLVVRISYHLLVEGASVPLVRAFSYPVTMLNVLVVQPGLTVRGDQLLAVEPIAFQDTNYEVYQAEGLGPDTPLSIELVPVAVSGTTPVPGTSTSGEVTSQPKVSWPSDLGALVRSVVARLRSDTQYLLRWLGFGLTGLSLIAALFYPRMTNRRTRK
jgi:hypothetical protein